MTAKGSTGDLSRPLLFSALVWPFPFFVGQRKQRVVLSSQEGVRVGQLEKLKWKLK